MHHAGLRHKLVTLQRSCFSIFVDEGYTGCEAMSRGVISGAKKIAALSEANLRQFLERKVLAHRLVVCLEDG